MSRLAQPIGAMAIAAVEGATHAAAAAAAPAGSSATASPEALQGAVAAAMQPVVEQLKVSEGARAAYDWT